MPSYLSLINWTDQGIRNVKDAPQRVDNFKKAVEAQPDSEPAWCAAGAGRSA